MSSSDDDCLIVGEVRTNNPQSESMSTLTMMGFSDISKNQFALERSGGDLQAAIDLLFDPKFKAPARPPPKEIDVRFSIFVSVASKLWFSCTF